jgi:hypothetical protein
MKMKVMHGVNMDKKKGPIICIPGMHNHLLSRSHIIDLSSLGHIEIHQINYERKTHMFPLIFVEKPELL